MTAVEVLRKARALLVERGWCKGELLKSDGRCCSMGAIYVALGMDEQCRLGAPDGASLLDDPPEEAHAALDALCAATETANRRHLWGWNDSSYRTESQVIAAFDKAIALAEASS